MRRQDREIAELDELLGDNKCYDIPGLALNAMTDIPYCAAPGEVR